MSQAYLLKTLFYLISGGDYQCDDTYTVVKGACRKLLCDAGPERDTAHRNERQNIYGSAGTVFVLDSKIDCHYYAKARLSMQWIQFSGIMVQNFFDMLYENNEQERTRDPSTTSWPMSKNSVSSPEYVRS